MRGLSYGTMHLSIGQEATAVGVCAALTDADYITSTHRGHGHCIAKGAEVKRMFAEFLGKETGYCRGRGGSMHIADPTEAISAPTASSAAAFPIAVGAALSAKKRKSGAVAVVVLRRRRQQRGRVPRIAQHRIGLEAAGDFRLRKQPIRHVDLDRALDGGQERRGPRRRLRHSGRHRRRQQLRGRRRGLVSGGGARATRRRADAHRKQDLSHARPFAQRSQPLPHQGGNRKLEAARSDRVVSKAKLGALGLLDAGRHRRDPRAGRSGNRSRPGVRRRRARCPRPPTSRDTSIRTNRADAP